MFREWLAEYLRHPVPAASLAAIAVIMLILGAIVFVARHTDQALPAKGTVTSKAALHTSARPSPAHSPSATPPPPVTVSPTSSRGAARIPGIPVVPTATVTVTTRPTPPTPSPTPSPPPAPTPAPPSPDPPPPPSPTPSP